MSSQLVRHLPMLAKPLTEKISIAPGRYIAEEKYNGLRMLIRRYGGSFDFWSRTGKQTKLEPLLSREMKASIMGLPHGVYDGELVHKDEGRKHYDVTTHANSRDLRYVIFDLLQVQEGQPCMGMPQQWRRAELQGIFDALPYPLLHITLARQWEVNNHADVQRIAREVWDRFGEGLMVKNRSAVYLEGKRSDAFLKVKLWHIGVAPIVGFEATKGEIMARGECAVTVLKDADGNFIPLKTLDDELCRRLEANPQSFIGRNVMFEYTGRTPDGKYENAKWDRFEDE